MVPVDGNVVTNDGGTPVAVIGENGTVIGPPTNSDVPKVDFEAMKPHRGRKVVKPSLESEDTLFVFEWGVRDAFEMVHRVQAIAKRLMDAGILKRQKEDPDLSEQQTFSALLEVVSACREDVYSIVKCSCFKDTERVNKLEDEDLDDMAIGDLALCLRAVWHVNMEVGSLKKALGGVLGAGK